ncbi:hypothetical protein OEZ85_007074 [Tetradesmus obliquus]|uniref:Uncharacterized protein n=1 Tax=Tetradesmus obliquus TaxID=3088 RepID=A0ABY8TWJ5_TETOB|nr:hypothetical protein OEZ85_007074 [Tetradesmus obliquus]
MWYLIGSGSKGRGSSRQRPCPRSSALTAVLLVLLLGSSAHAAPQQRVAARKLLQVTAASSTPVSINQPAAASEPQVTATGGPAFDAFKSAAADTLGSLFLKKEKAVEAAPAPVATIVVPQPQVAAVPTTTSGVTLKTDTPVSLASPINVTTPVKQKNVQIGGGGGQDLLNTLINLGNLGANTAAAGGAITGAVAGFLDTFLPNCPPPIPGAPPIPGCQLISGLGTGGLGSGLNGLLGALPVAGGKGGALLPSTVVNVNSPGATGTDVNALSLSTARTDGAAAAGARPGPGGAKSRSASSPKPAATLPSAKPATTLPSPKAPAKPAASSPAQPK